MSEDVTDPLMMVNPIPVPTTALFPPVMVISPEVTLPNVRAFCLLLKMFQSDKDKNPEVVPFAWEMVILGLAPPELVNGEDAVTVETPVTTATPFFRRVPE